MRSFFVLLFIYFIVATSAYGQSCKTDAKVITSKNELQQSIKSDPAKNLVQLKKVIPRLVIDMPYATAHNFTKSILYYHPVAYMRVGPANALAKVQADLNKQGLALKVFDAFRPFSVTCRMWQLVKDKRYVANPKEGSYHNRGLAVDLTIIDIKTGKELDMGTGFDNFTDSAHHSFMQLPPQVLANRALLKGLMHKHGFTIFPTEWWHYHFHNDKERYEVIDLSFDDLKAVL
jgi:D-alanyl-D-alanine dipeptidase